jgi:hypothetical protein
MFLHQLMKNVYPDSKPLKPLSVLTSVQDFNPKKSRQCKKMNIAKAMKGTTQMNKSTIDMAREAGLEGMTGHPALQRLVALVRADEREACAVLFNQPHMEYFGQEIQDAIRNRGNT